MFHDSVTLLFVWELAFYELCLRLFSGHGLAMHTMLLLLCALMLGTHELAVVFAQRFYFVGGAPPCWPASSCALACISFIFSSHSRCRACIFAILRSNSDLGLLGAGCPTKPVGTAWEPSVRLARMMSSTDMA